jgi:FkbH-like protein
MKMRWAICSNTTITPLVRILGARLQEAGETSEFFVTQYGEAIQQILQPGSPLYTAHPDLVVLYFDLDQLRPGVDEELAFAAPSERANVQSAVIAEMLMLVRALRNNCAATLLVNSFSVAPRTVLGIGLDPVWKSAVRQINLRLSEELAGVPNCFQYDCDSLWAEVGWTDRDRRFEMLAQLPFGPKVQRLLVCEWLRYYRALRGLARKCVVVDLDNTLWRGILGEDGQNNIQMSDSPQGRPYRRLQQALRVLSRRGVLLAVCSKNNPADALTVLREHPDMLLREKDFAALQLNWRDKATNLLAIAKELNIGLQHIVFLDDNPAEREWVRDALPEVLVPDMPADAAFFADVLTECDLDTVTLTDEDRRRTQMYVEDRDRRTFQASMPSYEQFLQGLQLVVQIERLKPALIERAVQLCQRTNQFNITTRRHTAVDLQRFADAPDSAVFMASVRDRFGDYGWTGLAVAKKSNKLAEIDSFMVSCRVLGKQVEFALFGILADWARQSGCTELSAVYQPSPKNGVCAEFYLKCGLLPSDGKPNSFSRPLTDLPDLSIGHITFLRA